MSDEFSIIGPHFEPGLIGPNGRLMRFCKGDSSTASQSKTENKITDQRVAASEGAVAAGAGASINIQNADAGIIQAAGDAISKASEKALDANQALASDVVGAGADALRESTKFASDALDFSGDAQRLAFQESGASRTDALDFGAGAIREALGFVERTRQDANNLIRDTNENAIGRLTSNLGEAPQSVVKALGGYGAAAAVAIAIALIYRGKK